ELCGKGRSIESEFEGRAQHGPCHPEVELMMVTVEAIRDITLQEYDVAPAEVIAHAERALPRPVVRSSADIGVVGHEPIAFPESHLSLQADNPSPNVLRLGNAARCRKRTDRPGKAPACRAT